MPYWALARGFLTGKYRRGSTADSPRAGQASKYLDDQGIRESAHLELSSDELRGLGDASVHAAAS